MKYFLGIFCVLMTLIITTSANSYPDFTFDPNAAEDYLLFSYASYCQRSAIDYWNCTTCSAEQIQEFNMVSVIYNITTDTQSFVGYRNSEVIVAFRGSMDIQSWITNLQFMTTSYPNCPGSQVHEGFYKAWISVRDLVKSGIDDAIQACGTKCNTLVITGHSLGAALSSLCMMDMLDLYPQMTTYSYSFGSPRVGDDIWAACYNKIQPNQYRTVNRHDLVPHLPPQDVYNYHHVPTEVWYTTNTTYKVCDDSGEDPTCSDSVVGFSIWDHLHYFDQPCCCKSDTELEEMIDDYIYPITINNN
ncbi:triacylglycerol lipase-like protein triacylglycerol lipase [Tieghemostelium lacteum]|uniref:Triacylglycerol lipase-like protein triacylglycerol lipase n=1 Tax=Tieghemostelium lacteum TaxID=361077 RepID=A0A151Z5S2_TIELA|nr:triacylglycerol lipase-like protein triacylglycerol lipase [Tieghemostelium lacteum]|eukprot:KYQ89288.1 triacylglycerol lipase-like protein triacylglycerol lipase [Tieghemostelium lacteum]